MKKIYFVSLILCCIGCSKDTSLPATVPPPVIKFSELSPGVFQFTADGGGIINYSWSFGDNKAVSNESNPMYTYRFNGSYKVVLITQIKNGDYQKTETSVAVVSVNSLKEATPKFVTALDKNETTVKFTNPSGYVKKIDWEIIDLYDGTIVKSGNNYIHNFRWNGEHTVKMTATVEDKNGDTTYTDIRMLKISGNSPPKIAPELDMFDRGRETEVSNVFEKNISYENPQMYFNIEVSSGDPDNEDTKIFKPTGGGLGYIPVSYWHGYPHSGPFPLKLKCTNPNGTTTFTYSVKGIANVPYIENLVFTIPVQSYTYPYIGTKGSLIYRFPFNEGVLNSISVHGDNSYSQHVGPLFGISTNSDGFTGYQDVAQVSAEFGKGIDFNSMRVFWDLNYNNTKVGYIKANSTNAYFVRIKPANKKYIYIPYGTDYNKKHYYCTKSVTIYASSVYFTMPSYSTLSDEWYKNTFKYVYDEIMLNQMKDRAWYYYTDFNFNYYKL